MAASLVQTTVSMHFWNPRGASTRRIARNKSLGVEIQPLTIRQAGPLVRTKAASESDPTTSLTGFVAFQPFDELQGELAGIEQSEQANGRASLARSDYAEELEAAVNAQINAELTFSYVYTALQNYFNRDTVALLGFARYFHESAQEERYHAQLLMDQQARRGGRVHLHTILAPSVMDFGHAEKGAGLWSMELALAMEKLNFIKLRQLHAVASQHNDPQMTQFIGDEQPPKIVSSSEDFLLQEQAADIKILSNYVTQLRLVGKGHGVWHFDRYLYENPKALGYDGVAHTLAGEGGGHTGGHGAANGVAAGL